MSPTKQYYIRVWAPGLSRLTGHVTEAGPIEYEARELYREYERIYANANLELFSLIPQEAH